MRSVSTSAWRISSMDSCLVCFASLVKPQFSCILACRKYWLIAVSSAVSCSLRNSMTRASPCMPHTPRIGLIGSKRTVLDRLRGVWHVRVERLLLDQLADPVEAAPAAGARPARVADRLLGARAATDRGTNLALANHLTDTHVHELVLCR